MTDDRLVDPLADRGFHTVADAGLPGGWSTDGEWTVCVETRQRGGGMGSRSTLQHEVSVFDCEAGLISIDSEPAGVAVDTSCGAAIRRALEAAGFEGSRPMSDAPLVGSWPSADGHAVIRSPIREADSTSPQDDS